MLKEIIVVEGLHDEQKIKSIYQDASVIVTGGSEISEQTKSLIYQASIERGVILMLDPDYPGRQITQKILDIPGISNIKIAALSRHLAYSKNRKKIGIEHATKEDIIACLEGVVSLSSDVLPALSMKDLFHLELNGHSGSKERRIRICERLHIPYCNGKTLLKYCHMLQLSLKELSEIIDEENWND
ncbi:MAG: ribonuclease M5 [Candidatus Izemoplasmatales bacterium]